MSATGPDLPRLRAVASDQLVASLREAMAGGPPIAPLPDDLVERDRALGLLQLEQPVTEPEATAVVPTSGSTGQPKAVVLSRAALQASVAATHARLGGPGDWVLALPGHYVAGLMVVARAVIADTQVRLTRPDLGDLGGVARTAADRRYISLVPTQLARARAGGRWDVLAGFDAVLVGGGPLTPDLLGAARAAGINVVTSYGMAETCGGCVYDGRPLDGVRVVLADDDRIMIGGPVLSSGYRLRPDLTAASRAGDFLLTADRGRWIGERLEVQGRLDEVVITGGLKVDLGQVEGLVRVWAGRAGGDGVAVGVPDADWGTRIVAVSDVPGDLEDLQRQVRAALPAYAAPRALRYLDPLPRLASGKPDRQTIAALIAAEPVEVVPT
ncbi:MAG TPA: AMP-binding protein [Propionibacteriaceae bacterium]|nr:AMP-binding protein [Propionibacteriaceae bacterium]